MIHWLPDQPVQHGAAAAVSGWSGTAPGVGSDDELAVLDAVIAVTKDLSGQADAGR
ncbi:hypothetical protein AB5J55_34095 [Streptomyces sp. R11]|uniref:Uncharacterized protein n=1 Tax=Streptomyces sp. R11 TaxID=3238625 RepID=A0AB39N957_9ACTN